ncbi:zf-HC2 domain-containing protein [Haloactinomyces albus]|uniref:Putative zinc-finger domain-containing protein n=1 Tax=Haloactinomyces albus TaxID=1352928 RepID=A0AAE3ZFC4_9ACTN|nr:zf-HC2 domain-containing protein [Haloactinomyces albus]MDR7302835.1 hypothetical protein [Haloactinomyces albus]
MSALRGWGLPEQHLALDALVAFVDGELTPNAHDRAAAHIAKCSACKADAAAQRQARSAIRAADTPSMSPQFLRTLQSIPGEAQLPDRPDELALTEDGRLVALNHRDANHSGASSAYESTVPVLGSSARLGRGRRDGDGGTPLGGDVSEQASEHSQHPRGHGRRAKQGASVVFSGIVLGALAFMNIPAEESDNTVTTVPRPFPQGDTAREDATVPASAPATTPSATPASGSQATPLREIPAAQIPTGPDLGTSTTPASAAPPAG